MPASLAIHRLSARTPVRAQPVAARLALQSLGADLEDALPRGLPPQALLWLRRLRLQAPEAALLRPAPAAWRQDWIAAGREQMDTALAQAVRPALGPVPESAPAVLFADAAEMLACLALAERAGQLDRWWWRGLLGRAWPNAHAAWAARPEAQAAALRLLVRVGQGGAVRAWSEVPWADVVPSAAVPVARGDVIGVHPASLQPAAAAVKPLPESRVTLAQGASEPAVVQVEQDVPQGVPASTAPQAAPADAGPVVPPSVAHGVPASEAQAAGERHRGRVSNADRASLPEPLQARVLRTPSSMRLDTDPALHPVPDEVRPATGEPTPSLPRPVSAVTDAAHIDPAAPAEQPVRVERATAPDGQVAPADSEPAWRHAPTAERDPVATPPAEPAEKTAAAWPWPQALPSRQTPLLFIVNALLEDGLYPDFTRPRDPGLPVPLGVLLAELAHAWHLPADPLQAALRERSPDWRAPDVMPAAPGAAAGPWPEWRAAYARSLRRRLCRRLGLRAAAWPQALTLARPARLWLSEAEWVAEFDLGTHDVAWRLAGLDRDPGWLPSVGVSVRFVFTV